MKFIGVIGEGAWGAAVARVLADNGHQVRLWCHDEQVAQQINREHVNRIYMPAFDLPKTIVAETELTRVLHDCDVIFISTPTAFFRGVVSQCKPFYTKNQLWVILSKGIENESLCVPSQILQEILDPTIAFAVLGGPSFAQEVMARKLTGVMVAADQEEIARKIAKIVANNYFRVTMSTDVLGVQLGGALKNVGALLMGVAQGAGFSDNTRALLFTRCWQELNVLAHVLGAQVATLADLAGIGDLFLTVLGGYSRNLALGKSIGAGVPTRYHATDVCVLPEGINTIKSVKQLVEKNNLCAPLCCALYAIIFDNASCNLLLQVAATSVDWQAK